MNLHCINVIHSHWFLSYMCTCNCMLHSYSMHTTNASITVCRLCCEHIVQYVLLADIWVMVADFVKW